MKQLEILMQLLSEIDLTILKRVLGEGLVLTEMEQSIFNRQMISLRNSLIEMNTIDCPMEGREVRRNLLSQQISFDLSQNYREFCNGSLLEKINFLNTVFINQIDGIIGNRDIPKKEGE